MSALELLFLALGVYYLSNRVSDAVAWAVYVFRIGLHAKAHGVNLHTTFTVTPKERDGK